MPLPVKTPPVREWLIFAAVVGQKLQQWLALLAQIKTAMRLDSANKFLVWSEKSILKSPIQ
jgi:hypothetical protein